MPVFHVQLGASEPCALLCQVKCAQGCSFIKCFHVFLGHKAKYSVLQTSHQNPIFEVVGAMPCPAITKYTLFMYLHSPPFFLPLWLFCIISCKFRTVRLSKGMKNLPPALYESPWMVLYMLMKKDLGPWAPPLPLPLGQYEQRSSANIRVVNPLPPYLQ